MSGEDDQEVRSDSEDDAEARPVSVKDYKKDFAAVAAQLKQLSQENELLRLALSAHGAVSEPEGLCKSLKRRWKDLKFLHTGTKSVVDFLKSLVDDDIDADPALRKAIVAASECERMLECQHASFCAAARDEDFQAATQEEYMDRTRINVTQPADDFVTGKKRLVEVQEKVLEKVRAAVKEKYGKMEKPAQQVQPQPPPQRNNWHKRPRQQEDWRQGYQGQGQGQVYGFEPRGGQGQRGGYQQRGGHHH